jgi:4-amino-4-deoxy-L-arabinose transferase-like glycosyltransferase
VAQLIASHGRLPVFGPDADLYVRLDQVGIPIESHALAPPLPYLVDAALIRVLPAPPLVAARLGSLLAGLVAVAFTYALARALLPGLPTPALAVAALVAAVPQTSFLAATVNTDIFALAAAAAVGYLATRALHPLGALAFGLALGAALLTKYTVYPVAVLAALAAAWHARARAPVALAPTFAAAALLTTPWLLHNWRLYGAPWPITASEVAIRALTPAVAIPGAPGAQQLLSGDYARSWWEITFRSFWAGFGRVDLFAPTWCYALIVAALAVAVLGLLRALAAPRARARLRRALREPAVALAIAWPLALILAAVAASQGRYYPVHGRYLIPALPPLAVALVLGWRAAAPAPWRAAAPWALAATVAALNLYCLLGVVVPAYHGPAAARVVVTVDAPRPGDTVAEFATVQGWAVVTGREAWEPGRIGGASASHAPAATVRAHLADQPDTTLPGGSVRRPDVARALSAPSTADAGFEFRWDARAASPGPHGLEVCAEHPAARASRCVPVTVLVPAR